MLSVFDRYLLRSLIVNYVIALSTMLSLYVVLDLFVNMDEFTEDSPPLTALIRNVVGYYLPNLLLYFSQLSSTITLFACMASLARMRRLNELTAVLSSGVSLYRIARPVVLFGVVTTGLLILDTEVLIPRVAHKLARDHEDAEGTGAYPILFLRDGDDALVSAAKFDPITHDLHGFLVLRRNAEGRVASMIEADRATWRPPSPMSPQGLWRLERGRRTSRVRTVGSGLGPRDQKRVTAISVYESELSPEAIEIRQSKDWIRFLSIAQLSELQSHLGGDVAKIVQTKHERRTQPIIGLIMLLLGLPFFLNRAPANILSDAGKCMAVCGLCYVATFVAQSLRPESSSALPAWAPIFVFGTIAIVLVDRIRT